MTGNIKQTKVDNANQRCPLMIIHSSSGLICLYHKKDNLYGGNIASGVMGIFVVNSTIYGILFDTLSFLRTEPWNRSFLLKNVSADSGHGWIGKKLEVNSLILDHVTEDKEQWSGCGGVHVRVSKTGINVCDCSNPYTVQAVVWSEMGQCDKE